MAEEQDPLNEEVLPDTDTTESDVETPTETTAPTTGPQGPPLPEAAGTAVTPDAPQAQAGAPEEPVEDDSRPPAGPGVPDNPTRTPETGEAWLKHSYPGDDKGDTKLEDESTRSWGDDLLRVPFGAGEPNEDRIPGVAEGAESLLQYGTMAAIKATTSPLGRSYANMLEGEEYWPVASEVLSIYRAAPQAFARGWNWANLHGAKWFTEGKGEFGDSYGEVVNLIDEDIFGGSPSTSTDIVGGIAAWMWGFFFFKKSVGMGASTFGATGLTGSILGASKAPKIGPAVASIGGKASWKGASAYLAHYGATFTLPSIAGNQGAWDPRTGGFHHALASFWEEGKRPPAFQSYLDAIGYEDPPGSYYGEDGKLLAGQLLTQQWLLVLEGAEFEIAGETVMRGLIFPILKHFHRQARKGGTVGAGSQHADDLIQGGSRSEGMPSIAGHQVGMAVDDPVVRMMIAEQIKYELALHGAMAQTFARSLKEGMTHQEARLAVAKKFPQGPTRASLAELQANQIAKTFGVELGEARNVINMFEVVSGALDRLWIPDAGRNLMQIPGLEALLQTSGVLGVAKLPVRAQESAAQALGKALARGKVANNLEAKVQFLRDRKSFSTDLIGSTVPQMDGKAQPFMSPQGDFMKRVDRVFRDENRALRVPFEKTFIFDYTVSERPMYEPAYRADGTLYSRKIEGRPRRVLLRIKAETEEQARKIFNDRKRSGEFIKDEMDNRVSGEGIPKPVVRIKSVKPQLDPAAPARVAIPGQYEAMI
ncbi:MAG: hypothetical protein CL902_03355, partial [Dehalococcoidia bacterium]|nr:hypothetical protein [Dehalococcoidia bacterium]